MQPFTRFAAVALPLPLADINTDQILPARFLRKQRADGFGQYLFHDIRFDENYVEKPEFLLNKTPYRDAKIIVAGPNFGCGSSREMAVWAVADYGVRVLISPKFGDIFYSNCIRNGLLPLTLPADDVQTITQLLQTAPGQQVEVDLERQIVGAGGHEYAFDIDPFNKKCLVQGIDEISFTLRLVEHIDAYEQHKRDAG
jgi:3-isopropylmalate/(R)-2-methylmalate dehydratase small subunit